MGRQPKEIRSDIAWSSSDRIVLRGRDLTNDILGHLNLGDVAFLQLTGTMPTPQQSAVFNAIVITLVEHGITPSAIAARMTYAGAPEALQAAVAAGLCGLGSVFVGSMEGTARMLSQALPFDAPDGDLKVLAAQLVEEHRRESKNLPGLGHPIHKPIDPRTPRLFQIAEENGYGGRYVDLIQLVASEAERVSGKRLQVNATGAIGAICCELKFPWKIVRGFGVMARAIGLVGHILEESERPMAIEIWQRVEEEASRHSRNTG
jgi:citrate synthase